MSAPQENSLDREIAAALDGVDLQGLGSDTDSAPTTGQGSDKLWPGVVTGISGDDVIVELGPRMQGVCSLREFEAPPAVGASLRFAMRGREDDLWVLSIQAAKEVTAWESLELGSHVKARVSGQNQGGLELRIGNNEAFMPASQVSLNRDLDPSTLIGQTLTCEVVELDRNRKRCVISRRRVEESERSHAMQESIGKLHTNMVLKGKVTRLESFGAFVDLGNGLEGLMHVSNISRKRVENPADLLAPGQEIEVKVLEIKDGGKRIGLGMKQLEPDPWDQVPSRYPAERQVTGKITRLMDFGAFVELEPGLEGLLHVSQLGTERVRRASDVLTEGEEVTVRIVNVDPGARRIALSRLDVRGAIIGSEDAVDADVIEEALAKPEAGNLGTNLGSLFKQAMQKGGEGPGDA
jgi:small subunit ribosomal protein S1